MMRELISDEMKKLVMDDIASGLSHRTISSYRGISVGTVSKIRNEDTDTPEVSVDYSKDTATVSVKMPNIHTLEQALKYGEVDLNKWEVDRHVINTWADKNQVKVWLKRKVTETMQLAIEGLIEQLKDYKPEKIKLPKRKDDPYMLELCLFDAHFGMLAWNGDTGNDYDIKIAETIYKNAIKSLLTETTAFNIAKITLPVGQDLFHINDPSNQTPKNNNKLDVDGRMPKVFQAVKMAVIEAIELCRQVAPVHVIWVPGNHDPETSYYLTEVLASRFYNDPMVTVDTEPKMRKHIIWGSSFIGYTHGDEEPQKELPRIFMDEFAMAWAQSDFREIHTGHYHKKREMQFVSADTFGSTVLRTIPSLCGTDAWHYKKGYIGKVKAAQAFLWHKMDGLKATFNTYHNKP